VPTIGASGFGRTESYDPSAKFEITVSEVDMRKNVAGRMLKARV